MKALYLIIELVLVISFIAFLSSNMDFVKTSIEGMFSLSPFPNLNPVLVSLFVLGIVLAIVVVLFKLLS